MKQETNPQNTLVDINLINDPDRLRERADALEANDAGMLVDKWDDTGRQWIQLESISAFFFDRRYRARPSEDMPCCPNCGSNERVICNPKPEHGSFFCPCNEPGPQYFNLNGGGTLVEADPDGSVAATKVPASK